MTVALITGANSGIGRGAAVDLAAKGWTVYGSMRSLDKGEKLAAMADEAGVEVHPVVCDVTDAASVDRAVAEVTEAAGQIDVLVNNAGIQFVSPIDEFPEDKWDAIIAINLSSAYHTIKAALPLMKARGWGRVINIASAHGLVASPFKSAYVAAKHGVLGITKTVALEVAEQGITVNAICPGYVWTPLVERQIPDTAKARGLTEEEVIQDVLLKAQPTKKFVTVDQLGALAVFLCSDEAASITGTSLPVDGGWVAQ
jgi:3-hydroxybutyrate dehydrogenase